MKITIDLTPEELKELWEKGTTTTGTRMPKELEDKVREMFLTPKPLKYDEIPCLVRGFFKNNPNEKTACISCPCPMCTPTCVVGVS